MAHSSNEVKKKDQKSVSQHVIAIDQDSLTKHGRSEDQDNDHKDTLDVESVLHLEIRHEELDSEEDGQARSFGARSSLRRRY